MRKKLFSILFFLAMILGTGRIAFANEQISAEISGDGQNQLSVKVRNSSNSEVNDVSYQLNLPQGYEVDGHLRAEIEERRVGKECRSRWSPYH